MSSVHSTPMPRSALPLGTTAAAAATLATWVEPGPQSSAQSRRAWRQSLPEQAP